MARQALVFMDTCQNRCRVCRDGDGFFILPACRLGCASPKDVFHAVGRLAGVDIQAEAFCASSPFGCSIGGLVAGPLVCHLNWVLVVFWGGMGAMDGESVDWACQTPNEEQMGQVSVCLGWCHSVAMGYFTFIDPNIVLVVSTGVCGIPFGQCCRHSRCHPDRDASIAPVSRFFHVGVHDRCWHPAWPGSLTERLIG